MNSNDSSGILNVFIFNSIVFTENYKFVWDIKLTNELKLNLKEINNILMFKLLSSWIKDIDRNYYDFLNIEKNKGVSLGISELTRGEYRGKENADYISILRR